MGCFRADTRFGALPGGSKYLYSKLQARLTSERNSSSHWRCYSANFPSCSIRVWHSLRCRRREFGIMYLRSGKQYSINTDCFQGTQ